MHCDEEFKMVDLEQLTVEQWLKSIHFEEYCTQFEKDAWKDNLQLLRLYCACRICSWITQASHCDTNDVSDLPLGCPENFQAPTSFK